MDAAQELFDKLDINGRGEISQDDIYESLKLLELEMDPESLIMQLGLSDKNASINFEEFNAKLSMMGIQSESESEESDYGDMEEAYNSNASLENVLGMLEFSQEEMVLEDMMSQLRENKRGKVDYSELERVISVCTGRVLDEQERENVLAHFDSSVNLKEGLPREQIAEVLGKWLGLQNVLSEGSVLSPNLPDPSPRTYTSSSRKLSTFSTFNESSSNMDLRRVAIGNSAGASKVSQQLQLSLKENEELLDEVQELRDQQQRLQKANNELQAKTALSTQQVNRLQRRVTDGQANERELTRQLQDLMDQEKKDRLTVSAQKREISELRETMALELVEDPENRRHIDNASTTSLMTPLPDSTVSSEERIQILTRKLSTRKVSIENLKAKVKRLEVEKADATSELVEVRSTIGNLSPRTAKRLQSVVRRGSSSETLAAELTDVALPAKLEKELADAKTQIAEAKTQIAEAQSELTKVQSELATTKSDLNKSRSEVTELSAASKRSTEKFEAVKTELATTKETMGKELADKSQELSAVQTKLGDTTVQLRKSQSNATTNKSTSERARVQLASLQAELENNIASLEKSQDEVVAANAATKQSREELANLKAELATTNSALTKAQEDVATANATNDSSRIELAAVRTELGTQTTALDIALNLVATSRAADSKVKEDLATIQLELASNKGALDKANKDAAAANAANKQSREELATVQAELSVITASHTKAKAAFTKANTDNKAIRWRMTTLKTKLTRQSSALATSLEQVTAANAATKQFKEELAGVRAELATATSALNKARSETNTAKLANEQAVEEHKAEIAKTKAKADAETASVRETLNAQVATITAQMQVLTEKNAAKVAGEATAEQLAAANIKIDALELKVLKSQQELTRTQESQSQLQKDLSASSEQHREATAQITAMKLDLEAAKDSQATVQKDLDASTAQQHSLTAELTSVKQELALAKDSETQLKQTLGVSSEQQLETTTQLSTAKEELEVAKASQMQLEKDLSVATEKNRSATSQLTAAKEEQEKGKESQLRLEKELSVSTQQNRSLSSQLSAATEDLKQAKETLLQLEKSLSKSEEQHRSVTAQLTSAQKQLKSAKMGQLQNKKKLNVSAEKRRAATVRLVKTTKDLERTRASELQTRKDLKILAAHYKIANANIASLNEDLEAAKEARLQVDVDLAMQITARQALKRQLGLLTSQFHVLEGKEEGASLDTVKLTTQLKQAKEEAQAALTRAVGAEKALADAEAKFEKQSKSGDSVSANPVVVAKLEHEVTELKASLADRQKKLTDLQGESEREKSDAQSRYEQLQADSEKALVKTMADYDTTMRDLNKTIAGLRADLEKKDSKETKTNKVPAAGTQPSNHKGSIRRAMNIPSQPSIRKTRSKGKKGPLSAGKQASVRSLRLLAKALEAPISTAVDTIDEAGEEFPEPKGQSPLRVHTDSPNAGVKRTLRKITMSMKLSPRHSGSPSAKARRPSRRSSGTKTRRASMRPRMSRRQLVSMPLSCGPLQPDGLRKFLEYKKGVSLKKANRGWSHASDKSDLGGFLQRATIAKHRHMANFASNALSKYETFIGDYLGLANDPDFMDKLVEHGGDRSEIIVFSSVVKRCLPKTKFMKSTRPRRTLVVTTAALYELNEKGNRVKYRTSFGEFHGFSLNTIADDTLALLAPRVGDCLYVTFRRAELVARMMQCFEAYTKLPIKLRFVESILLTMPNGDIKITYVDEKTAAVKMESYKAVKMKRRTSKRVMSAQIPGRVMSAQIPHRSPMSKYVGQRPPEPENNRKIKTSVSDTTRTRRAVSAVPRPAMEQSFRRRAATSIGSSSSLSRGSPASSRSLRHSMPIHSTPKPPQTPPPPTSDP